MVIYSRRLRSQANRRGFGQDKAKRVSSVKRKGLPPEGVSLKLRCQTSPAAAAAAAAGVGRACDSGMANKENELASEDMWGVHYSDKCGHPLTSGEGSKMAGVGYSDAIAQALDHWFTLGAGSHQEMVAGTFHEWQKPAQQLFRVQEYGSHEAATEGVVEGGSPVVFLPRRCRGDSQGHRVLHISTPLTVVGGAQRGRDPQTAAVPHWTNWDG
ncbi:hypothetical protein CRUP_012927, partial [Coryphaenoides rupestris]